MDNECFESTWLWKESKQKLTIFPHNSLLICGIVLITAHWLVFITISFQVGFDFLEHTRIIMEYYKYTIGT